nr:hypothetical protein [Parasporobacterium paucivorans]
MLSRLFRFQRCRSATITTLIIWGRKLETDEKFTFRRQYMTRMHITAGGRILPR